MEAPAPFVQRRWLAATLVALCTLALVGDVVATLGRVLGRAALAVQLAPAQVAVAVGAIALALVWVAQAWRNMKALGSTETRSATWAALMWLAPIMNGIHIPRAMKTLWNESERPPLPRARRVVLVSVWWWCLCATLAIGTAAFVLRRVPSAPSLLGPALDVARLAIGGVAAALFCAIVLLVDARQRGPYSPSLIAR